VNVRTVPASKKEEQESTTTKTTTLTNKIQSTIIVSDLEKVDLSIPVT